MNGSENGNFASEFLVEVAGVGRGLKLGNEWRGDAFMVDIVKVHGTEVWVGHDFEGIGFA
jgi:hypothetical protein